MINEIKVLTTMNIILKNNVYNIHKDYVPVDKVAAAAFWLQNTTSHIKNSDAKINILKFIYDIVEKRLPEFNFWLLTTNSAWQPDTPIVRYKGFWSKFKSRGIDIPTFIKSYENNLKVMEA